MDIRLNPIADSHVPMLKGWLRDAHARQWWGDPETQLELIGTAWDTGEAVGYVASINNVATAYIQSWVPSEFYEEPWQQEFPHDAVGVDIFASPRHKTGQGFGVTIIRSFTERLRRKGGCNLFVDPDLRNVRAIATYKSAGFVPFAIWKNVSGGTLLMCYRPPEN